MKRSLRQVADDKQVRCKTAELRAENRVLCLRLKELDALIRKLTKPVPSRMTGTDSFDQNQ